MPERGRSVSRVTTPKPPPAEPEDVCLASLTIVAPPSVVTIFAHKVRPWNLVGDGTAACHSVIQCGPVPTAGPPRCARANPCSTGAPRAQTRPAGSRQRTRPPLLLIGAVKRAPPVFPSVNKTEGRAGAASAPGPMVRAPFEITRALSCAQPVFRQGARPGAGRRS